MHINKKCRELRELVGLSQAKFAIKYGITPMQVSSFELGKSSNIRHFERYLNLSLENGLETDFLLSLKAPKK